MELVTGSGEWTYRVIHDWAKPPDGVSWGNTHAVQEDSHGRIYVFHTVHASSTKPYAMVVFDPAGQAITSWGEHFADGAHGMQLVREGSQEYLYLSDIRRRMVVKTTLEGEEIFRIGYPTESESYRPDPSAEAGPKYDEYGRVKYKPTNCAIAPDGSIYVADGYGSSHINRYRPDGAFVSTFGGPGSEAGQLLVPHGIWIDTRENPARVLVADRSNRRLQYFSLEGEQLGFVEGTVDLPCHFDEKDGVLLIPDLAARVTLLDRENNLLAHLGQGGPDYRQRRLLSRSHFIPGQFICPHGACFDGEGNILVTEWVETGRITKLERRQ